MTEIVDPPLPIKVYINGADVTPYYVTRSLNMNLALGQDLDSCAISLYDFDGALGAVAGWDELRVDELGYGSTLFTGFIVSSRQRVMRGGRLRWELAAQDKGVLLNKTIASGAFAKQTGAQIVASLCATYAPWLNTTHIAASPTLYDLRFDRATLSDCIKKLAELDGYEWWVDAGSALWYVPQASVAAAPFNVGDALSAGVVPYIADSLDVSRDYVDIRNRVVVHGGTRASAPVTELFTGNGTLTEFVVQHTPVNVYINILVGVTSMRFGREFIDNPADYPVLTNWSTGKVKFANAPANGAQIQIIYTYDQPVRVTMINTTSAALYCPVEIYSPPTREGYFDYIHVDGALTTQAACETVASQVLQRYAYERVTGNFTVPRLGLQPGQMVGIADTTLKWNASTAQYLIRRVTVREVKPKIFECAVSFGNRKPSLLDALLGLAGATGGVAAGASGGQGDILSPPVDLRQPTGYQYVTLAGGERILVPVYHVLLGTGLDFSDANNSQYIGLL